jgi:hypothetical protein
MGSGDILARLSTITFVPFVQRHFFQTKHFLNVFEKTRNRASIQSGTLPAAVRQGFPLIMLPGESGS